MIFVSNADSPTFWLETAQFIAYRSEGETPPLMNSGCLSEGKEQVRIYRDFEFGLKRIFQFEGLTGIGIR